MRTFQLKSLDLKYLRCTHFCKKGVHPLPLDAPSDLRNVAAEIISFYAFYSTSLPKPAKESFDGSIAVLYFVHFQGEEDRGCRQATGSLEPSKHMAVLDAVMLFQIIFGMSFRDFLDSWRRSMKYCSWNNLSRKQKKLLAIITR